MPGITTHEAKSHAGLMTGRDRLTVDGKALDEKSSS